MPVKPMASGPFWAFVVAVTAPLKNPVVIGVKVMTTWQLALTARVDPQLVVKAYGPVAMRLVMVALQDRS